MNALIDALRAELGVVRHSEWLTVDQSMIDRFADATLDHQFIHVDPTRAAATPLGGTIAHGFLTLSLLPHLSSSVPGPGIPNRATGVNSGLDRGWFTAPLRSGNRIRAAKTPAAVEEKQPGRFQRSDEIVVEIEGQEKPALVATWITQFII